MKAEHWQQVEQLYHAALKRKAEGRASFLDEACSGDEELRREVESLLSYEGRAGDFIESPALEVAAKMMAERQDQAIAAGQIVNQYKIISHLGSGGMGEVYLAEDTRLKRKVALKFLPMTLTEDTVHLRRFELEARAVAALSHPNVCTIHEVIETGEGRHCIVMEYVEGVTMRERLAEGRIEVGEALDAVIQVASALTVAHTAGIVHRDIKPENLMLRRDGYVKVLDFGLAKLMEKKSEPLDNEAKTRALELKTSPGILLGTIAYMSPEQARGLAVDARTDVWSLGVVLYEMVTGQKPFAGATPTDVIISIAEREPAQLTSRTPEAPIGLERIVTKALAKDRDERYQTADDLLVDLRDLKRELVHESEVERHQRTKPTAASTIAVPDRSVRASRLFPHGLTRSRISILTTLMAMLIIGGFILARYIPKRSTPTAQTEIKSLALLPLRNASGDATQDYFAAGLTEDLINDLAKIDTLRVISRPAVMRFAGTDKTPSDIGRELHVDAVVTGSVVRTGDDVRVALQLVHVLTGQNLWTKDYERGLRSVLTLQADVRRDVAETIGLKTSSQPDADVPSVNAEAYDQYLRGQFHLYRQTKADNEAAIAALEKAVAADTNFAAAHAELAQAYVWKFFLFAPGEKQLEEKAFIEVKKALALDPNSAVAYLARGRLLWTPANHFPHDRAIKEYRHALSLNPTLDEARNQLALVYCHIGAFSEALQESQLALTTDPNNHLAKYRIGQTLNFQGKYDEALSVLRAIPRDTNPALVGHQIAWALFNLGKREEASALLEQLLKDHPEDAGGVFTSVQAVLAASTGQERVANAKIKSAIEKGKGFGHFHHTAYHIACAYALMNESEQAIKWLEAAADDGFPCYPLFATDTNLDKLRQDARFVSFLAKQRQQWEYFRTIL
jgi:serine/threonine protein kinase/tetratricopeptide (TPR) repeat protein